MDVRMCGEDVEWIWGCVVRTKVHEKYVMRVKDKLRMCGAE